MLYASLTLTTPCQSILTDTAAGRPDPPPVMLGRAAALVDKEAEQRVQVKETKTKRGGMRWFGGGKDKAGAAKATTGASKEKSGAAEAKAKSNLDPVPEAVVYYRGQFGEDDYRSSIL